MSGFAETRIWACNANFFPQFTLNPFGNKKETNKVSSWPPAQLVP
jgi:hypothetical protein